MDRLGDITGILRDYMNRCDHCGQGRNKSCPWIAAFGGPDTSLMPKTRSDETSEDRAIAGQLAGGGPCTNQITYNDLIDQLHAAARRANLPPAEGDDEILLTLAELEEIPSRLPRLTPTLRPAFTDPVTAAIGHILAVIDFRYLSQRTDILSLIQCIHPDYDRDRMFRYCAFPAYLVQQYKSTAKPVGASNITPEPLPSPYQQSPGTRLPSLLATDKAMVIWHKAQDAGLVDADYHFISNRKTELTIFVANFSFMLYKEYRWAVFNEWEPYKYYAKTFSEYNSRKDSSPSPGISAILKIFET